MTPGDVVMTEVGEGVYLGKCGVSYCPSHWVRVAGERRHLENLQPTGRTQPPNKFAVGDIVGYGKHTAVVTHVHTYSSSADYTITGRFGMSTCNEGELELLIDPIEAEILG